MTSSSLLSTFNSLGLATTANQGSSAISTSTSGSPQMLSQADFLKLLTTQLNNQDPTSPTDSNTMLNQMSQIATVSGINNLLSSFQTLSSSITSGQSLQAANLVGQNILAPGTQAYLTQGGAVSGNFTLTTATSDAKLRVTDSKGNIVNQTDLGSQAAGTIPFGWNGTDGSGNPVASGVYNVSVTAMIGGKNTAVKTNLVSQVSSVSLSNGTTPTQLNLTGLGSIPLSSVVSIE